MAAEETTNMFCPNCGAVIPTNFKFCVKCGTSLAEAAEYAQSTPSGAFASGELESIPVFDPDSTSVKEDRAAALSAFDFGDENGSDGLTQVIDASELNAVLEAANQVPDPEDSTDPTGESLTWESGEVEGANDATSLIEPEPEPEPELEKPVVAEEDSCDDETSFIPVAAMAAAAEAIDPAADDATSFLDGPVADDNATSFLEMPAADDATSVISSDDPDNATTVISPAAVSAELQPEPAAAKEPEEKKSKKGAIIGIVIALAVIIIAAVFGLSQCGSGDEAANEPAAVEEPAPAEEPAAPTTSTITIKYQTKKGKTIKEDKVIADVGIGSSQEVKAPKKIIFKGKTYVLVDSDSRKQTVTVAEDANANVVTYIYKKKAKKKSASSDSSTSAPSSTPSTSAPSSAPSASTGSSGGSGGGGSWDSDASGL